MIKTSPNLWSLARDQWIASGELAEAVEHEANSTPLDFRTRLLIRDSLEALGQYWGRERLQEWLGNSPSRPALEVILNEDLGQPGFSRIIHRIMEPTRPETVLQFLRELGQELRSADSIVVGGSIALILANLLSRETEDIDVVNEVPAQIRSDHELLGRLARRYGLGLTHFQSHYLPTGWESRLHWLDKFGHLDVRLVDPKDVFLSKLFSKREKDRDDLRVLATKLDKTELIKLLQACCHTLRGEQQLDEQAKKNWYVLYGEPLP
jgi:hypothetical protein